MTLVDYYDKHISSQPWEEKKSDVIEPPAGMKRTQYLPKVSNNNLGKTPVEKASAHQNIEMKSALPVSNSNQAEEKTKKDLQLPACDGKTAAQLQESDSAVDEAPRVEILTAHCKNWLDKCQYHCKKCKIYQTKSVQDFFQHLHGHKMTGNFKSIQFIRQNATIASFECCMLPFNEKSEDILKFIGFY